MRRGVRQGIVGGSLAGIAALLMLAGSSPIPDQQEVDDTVMTALTPTIASTPATPNTPTAVQSPGTKTREPVVTATATATVTALPTLLPPTPTLTATPRATSTPTRTPTRIPTPTVGPTTTPIPTQTPVPTPTLTSDAIAAVAAVLAFDPAIPETKARLDQIVNTGGDVVPALAFALDDENPDRRWAALYVIVPLVRTEADIAVLRKALNDPLPSFRVYAAIPLAGRGVVESLPVLIEGMTLQEGLPYGDSPRSLSQLSQLTLEFYTGETFPNAQAWADWWTAVQGRIVWTGAGYEVR